MPIVTSMSKKKPKSKTREGEQKPSYLLPNEIIDELIEQFHGKDADSLLGTDGLAGQLKKQLAERIRVAALSHHLKAESAKASPGKAPITETAAAKKPC